MKKLRNKEEEASIETDKIDFYTLNENEEDYEDGAGGREEPRNRVNVEALEFDWIFKNDNAERLIGVLANLDNMQVLTSKPIKMFIDFMWSHY